MGWSRPAFTISYETALIEVVRDLVEVAVGPRPGQGLGEDRLVVEEGPVGPVRWTGCVGAGAGWRGAESCRASARSDSPPPPPPPPDSANVSPPWPPCWPPPPASLPPSLPPLPRPPRPRRRRRPRRPP